MAMKTVLKNPSGIPMKQQLPTNSLPEGPSTWAWFRFGIDVLSGKQYCRTMRGALDRKCCFMRGLLRHVAQKLPLIFEKRISQNSTLSDDGLIFMTYFGYWNQWYAFLCLEIESFKNINKLLEISLASSIFRFIKTLYSCLSKISTTALEQTVPHAQDVCKYDHLPRLLPYSAIRANGGPYTAHANSCLVTFQQAFGDACCLSSSNNNMSQCVFSNAYQATLESKAFWTRVANFQICIIAVITSLWSISQN